MSIVKIVDSKGVYPSALDKAIEEQRLYYAPAIALAAKRSNTK
jgi:hypothetical protein